MNVITTAGNRCAIAVAIATARRRPLSRTEGEVALAGDDTEGGNVAARKAAAQAVHQ